MTFQYSFGPVTSLSYYIQNKLKTGGMYQDTYWYIVCTLLQDVTVGRDIEINKVEVNKPYYFEIVGIIKGNELKTMARMNDTVLMICQPVRYTQEADIANIPREKRYHGKTAWFV
jgi:hypothetical protein